MTIPTVNKNSFFRAELYNKIGLCYQNLANYTKS